MFWFCPAQICSPDSWRPLILPPGSGLQDAWIYQPLSYQELLFEKYFCGPFFPNCLSESTEAPCVSSEQNHDAAQRVKPTLFRLDWSFKTCRRNTPTCSHECWRNQLDGWVILLFYAAVSQSAAGKTRVTKETTCVENGSFHNDVFWACLCFTGSRADYKDGNYKSVKHHEIHED